MTMRVMGFKFLEEEEKGVGLNYGFNWKRANRETYWIKSFGVPLRVIPPATVPKFPSI
jgi:hypothetical protein